MKRAEYRAALFSIMMKKRLGLRIAKHEERMWAYRNVDRCRASACTARRGGEAWTTGGGT